MNKLKRFLIAGAAVIMMVASLAACSQSTKVENSVNKERFQMVDIELSHHSSTGDVRIYVDTETGVMYVFIKEGYGGGLTVMVDENGKPLIWDEQKGEIK